jgi:hypothetical protein
MMYQYETDDKILIFTNYENKKKLLIRLRDIEAIEDFVNFCTIHTRCKSYDVANTFSYILKVLKE